VTLTISGVTLITYLLASIRLVAWLLVVPPFSTRAVPVLAKVLLAVGLALAVTPHLAAGAAPTDVVALVGTAVSEALVGASMGFVTYLVFAAVEAAGNLIDVFGGFSLATAFDPLSLNMNSVNGKLFSMLATMLLFATNAHLLVIGGLLRSFADLPVGAPFHLGRFTHVVTIAFSMFFTTAVQIALPLVAVLFVADLGLALLTKVAPQLNAITIMFPAKIGLTLLVVGLSFAVLPDALGGLLERLSEALGALG